MAIKKEKTNNCRLYEASRIISTNIKDGEGFIRFLDGKRGCEVCFPITREEYAHAASGAGTTVDAFDNGLSKAFRYQFLVCTKNIDDKETVTAIHSAPLEGYMSCDWSEELQRRIPDGGVLCTFRDNGGIDLNTFPSQFSSLTSSVLGKLSELSSITNTTMFTVGNTDCKVKTVDGNECMLVLKKKK